MECTQVLSEIAGGGADALAIASADSRVGPARAGPMENCCLRRARPACRDRSARTPARALRPQRTRDERAQTPRGRHTSFVRCEAVMELKPTSRARAASDLWSSHLICGLVGFTTVETLATRSTLCEPLARLQCPPALQHEDAQSKQEDHAEQREHYPAVLPPQCVLQSGRLLLERPRVRVETLGFVY